MTKKKKGDPRDVTAHPADEGGVGEYDDSEIPDGAVWAPSETTVVREKRTTSSGAGASSGSSHWGGSSGGAYNYVPPPDPGYSSTASPGASQSSGGTPSETGGGDTTTVYETRTPSSENPPAIAHGGLTLGRHAADGAMVVYETRTKQTVEYDPFTGRFRILWHGIPVYETRASAKFNDGELQSSGVRRRGLAREAYEFEKRSDARQATKRPCVPTTFEIGPQHVTVAVIIVGL